MRTNVNLGSNEQEFYKNMGKLIFTEIFGTVIAAEGLNEEVAYNVITGKQQNNELQEDNNANLQDLRTNTGRINNRIREVNDNLTAAQEYN